MMKESFGLALIVGAGVLLLKPRDFPLFARAAGRLVGFTVRSMRATKDAAEKVIKESADLANRQNPEMIAVRDNLKHSLSRFETLTTTVRRDIADVPLNPTTLLKKGWRSWDNTTNNPVHPGTEHSDQTQEREDSKTTDTIRQTVHMSEHTGTFSRNTSNLRMTEQNSLAGKSKDQFVSGADVVSRAIEEAALARQEQHVLGQAK